MEEKEFKKHAKIIMDMTLDYLMDGITIKTYISNLDIIVKKMANDPSNTPTT